MGFEIKGEISNIIYIYICMNFIILEKKKRNMRNFNFFLTLIASARFTCNDVRVKK